MDRIVRAYSEEENSRAATLGSPALPPSNRHNSVADRAKGHAQRAIRVFEQTENAKHRRGIDSLAQRFIVETNIAAGDGNPESGAGFGDAIHCFAELPHHFGLFRIAEIEAVSGGHRPRAATGYIARGFGHGMHRSKPGRELAPAAVSSHAREPTLSLWLSRAARRHRPRRGPLACSCAPCNRTGRISSASMQSRARRAGA